MWRQEVFLEAVLLFTSRFLLRISHNCGDSKDFVATKVANVATRTIRLDNADLNEHQPYKKHEIDFLIYNVLPGR